MTTTSRKARSRAKRAAKTIPAPSSRSPEDAEASADDEQSGETEASDATADDVSDDDDADAETPGEARRDRQSLHQSAEGDRLQGLHRPPSTRRSAPRSSAKRRSSTGCAPSSTSSLPICKASSAGLPTGCSAG